MVCVGTSFRDGGHRGMPEVSDHELVDEILAAVAAERQRPPRSRNPKLARNGLSPTRAI
jgi:hypothetical protein